MGSHYIVKIISRGKRTNRIIVKLSSTSNWTQQNHHSHANSSKQLTTTRNICVDFNLLAPYVITLISCKERNYNQLLLCTKLGYCQCHHQIHITSTFMNRCALWITLSQVWASCVGKAMHNLEK